MDSPRFTARFSLSAAHLYSPSPSEKGEIRASLNRLKSLLPSEIDTDEHPTILYIVGNLFVAGTVNKNGDAVSIEDGLKMYKSFEGQQINIEHNRGSVVGYIVHAGLSEFGTDKLIREDDVKASGRPYNVAIAVALWKIVDKELTQYILQSAEPGSELKDTLSFSFEVGFDSYSVVTLPKGIVNLSMATRVITPDSSEYAMWDKRLRVNGGLGSHKNEDVARVLIWPIFPLGGGIVAVPAGAVKGIVPVTTNTPDIEEVFEEEEESEAGLYQYSSTQVTYPIEDALPFVTFSRELPVDILYQGETEEEKGQYGIELEPHITVLYGIKGVDPKPIEACLEGMGPAEVRLGKISVFANDDQPYDVLKVDVESDDLHKMHALIKASCDNDSKWPDYHPHLTLAYLKKGAATPYIGDSRFEGWINSFASLVFSPHTGDKVQIILVGKETRPSERDILIASDSTATAAQTPEPPKEEDALKIMEGKKVTLNAVDPEGKKVLIEMDAAEAWKETHQRIDVYRKILDWLKGD